MTKEEWIDAFIETNFSNLYLYQKILLKQMLLLNGKENRHYLANRNIKMGGIKTTSKHYDEFVGKKGIKNGQEKK